MSQHRMATWSLAGRDGHGQTAAQNLFQTETLGPLARHSSMENSQRSLLGAQGRWPSSHSRACPPRNLQCHVYLGTVALSLPSGRQQSYPFPSTPPKPTSLSEGANVPGQSDSLEFLSVSQVRNYITNRSVTCAVALKILKPSPSHQPHVHLQQTVPPIDVQKEEQRTESKSTHTNFFIKTPSTLLPARRFFWPQQWSVLSGFASLPWGERSQQNIAHHPNYRPKKNTGSTKSLDATV